MPADACPLLPFRYYLRVRYGECDAQPVVFNARYGEYVDLAVTEFLRMLGFGTELGNGELDYQLVRQTIEWKASAHFDDVIEIAVSTRQIGRTSFTLHCEFRRAGAERLLASAETVYVRVNAGLQKTALTATFREAITHGAPGRVTDHASYLAAISMQGAAS